MSGTRNLGLFVSIIQRMVVIISTQKTRKSPLEVAPTTLATFSSCDLEL